MKTLFIMQGAPGSGKSTVARELARAFVAASYSTDEFHIEEDRVYRFKPEKAAEFHKRNQARCRQALENGWNVVIDNTAIHRWEARPYVEMAVELGVTVVFVRCTGRFDNDHGVPKERVERMRDEMEELSVEGCLNAVYPWERIKADELYSLGGCEAGVDVEGRRYAILSYRTLGGGQIINVGDVTGRGGIHPSGTFYVQGDTVQYSPKVAVCFTGPLHQDDATRAVREAIKLRGEA